MITIGTIFISYSSFIIVQHWENLGCILLFYLMWDTQEVTEKWTMERLNVSPYKLLFLNGVVGTCIFVLLFIMFAYIPCDLSFCDNGVVERFITSTTITLYALGYMLLCFVYNLFLMITKKVFTQTTKAHSTHLHIFYGG